MGDTIGPFGFAFGTNFRTEYLTIPNSLVAQFVSGGTNKPLTPTARFNRSNSLFTTRLGSIFTAAYRLNDNNKFFFRSFLDRNTYDNTQFASGIVSQPYAQQQTILDYTEEQLGFGQFGGEHHWGPVSVDWRTAIARSNQHEPDTRYTTYQAGFAPEQPPPSLPLSFLRFAQPYAFTNDSLGGTRIFNSLSEDSSDSAVDFTIPFMTGLPFTDWWSGLPAKFKFGPAYTFRRRFFEQRLFQFNLAPGQPVNVEAPPEVILQPSNIVPGVVNLNETTTQGDAYQVSEQIAAGYGLFDLPIVRDRLRFVGGVRLEYSNITLRTTAIGATQPVEVQKNNVDPLPVVQPRLQPALRHERARGLQLVGIAPRVPRARPHRLSGAARPARVRGQPGPRRVPHPQLRPALGVVLHAARARLAELLPQEHRGAHRGDASRQQRLGLHQLVRERDQCDADRLRVRAPEELRVHPSDPAEPQSHRERRVHQLGGPDAAADRDRGPAREDAAAPGSGPVHRQRRAGVCRPAMGNHPAALPDRRPDAQLRGPHEAAGARIFLQPRNQLDVVGIVPINWFSVPLTLKLGAENLLNDPYVQTQGSFVQTRYQRGIKVGMTISYSY